jgi:hypothetical protein
MRAASRCFAVILAAAVASAAAAAEATAEPDKRKVKEIRRALVAVQEDLDDATAALETFERRSKRLDGIISSAQRSLERSGAETDAAFIPTFSFVADLTRLSGAVAEKQNVEARITDLMHEMQALTGTRDEKIAELQAIVREAQEEDEIAGRTAPAGNKGASLTVRGSLITYSADWEAVAMCESSGRWHIDAYFDGGLQFLPSTWIGFGGGEFARYAHQASKKQQIAIAERVLAIQGPQAWPNCFQPLPVDF